MSASLGSLCRLSCTLLGLLLCAWRVAAGSHAMDDIENMFADLPGMMDDEPAASTHRAMCARCSKPSKVCLCSVLPAQKLATPKIKVLVLQHPEEAGSAKSTVALMQLCLADCRVVTGRKFRQRDLPADVLQAVEQGQRARSGIVDASTARWQRTLLLWPSPDSEALESVAASLHSARKHPAGTGDGDSKDGDGTGEHVLLVLLDGTWPSCGQMLQKSVSPASCAMC